MADFCKQCADELGFEINDFEGLITEKAFVEKKHVVAVLCEGCGPTFVNHKGECVDKHCAKHGETNR